MPDLVLVEPRVLGHRAHEPAGEAERVEPGAVRSDRRGVRALWSGWPPTRAAYAKAAVTDGAEMPLEYALAYERQLITTLFTTEDRKEGQRAILEKRSPDFKGE
jgi:enoyl-CoA hydratase